MDLLHTLTSPGWAVVIAVLSVARMARLITHDTFPPMEWARPRIAMRLGSKWEDLVVCPFCIAPYLTAVQILWWALLQGHGDNLIWFWLVPNLWWAMSYVAAIVVAYDQPD